MRYGICVPNLGQFADPRQVGELARRAEEAGWDGFFVGPQAGERDAAMRRIEAGPPS